MVSEWKHGSAVLGDLLQLGSEFANLGGRDFIQSGANTWWDVVPARADFPWRPAKWARPGVVPAAKHPPSIPWGGQS